VSTLAFLVPGSDVAVARSPMESPARAAGARFEQRGGWNVAVAYPGDERRRIDEAVGFADCSHLRKLELQGPPADCRQFCRQSGWHAITPTRVLGIGIADEVPDATDVTCALAALLLVGPGWRELLARFCAVDARERSFPVGVLKPASIARTPGYLLRQRDDELLLLFGWALGEYMYEVVADAASHLDGGPVGADALEAVHA
jgi:glycine cleavage system aminomethyltransferase T